VKFGRAVF